MSKLHQEYPNLFDFKAIECTQEQWDAAKWYFRIVPKSSELDKDGGYNNFTVVQILVDHDHRIGNFEDPVYKVLLFLGDGNTTSFGKEQYGIVPEQHLKQMYFPLKEKSRMFNKLAFMRKKDLVLADKVIIVSDSDNSDSSSDKDIITNDVAITE